MTASEDRAQANLELMREAIARLVRHDFEGCTALMTPDFRINLAGMPYQKRGIPEWKKNIAIMATAFPDFQLHIEDMFATDDKVALRARITGTHRGEFLGHQPSGKAIDYQSNELYRIENGKVAEEWICSDMLTMMTQIGALSKGQMVSIWLAGYRVWVGTAIGIAVGALLILAVQKILT
jgi:steroid delta-isomerase-like uncharacterized protein